MAAKFELYKDNGGQFRFRLRSEEGQILLAGEAYKSKAGAENGIAAVRTNAANDNRYERKVTAHGKHMFNLKAANGEIVGTSQQPYDSASLRDSGIASVQNDAPGAALDVSAA